MSDQTTGQSFEYVYDERGVLICVPVTSGVSPRPRGTPGDWWKGPPAKRDADITVPYREPSPDDFIPLHGPHHTTFGMAPYQGDSGDETDPIAHQEPE